MTMLKILYTLFISAGLFTTSFAQYIEAGIFAGAAVYNGDLSHKLIHLSEVHPAVGLQVGVPMGNYFSINFTSKITTLSGNDDNASKPAFQARNLDFTSKLFESGVVMHYYITGFNPLRNNFFSPYLLAGASYFHFNPKTKYNGISYELQPLGTEGQGTSAFPDREPYKLNEFSIPMGAGIKYSISRRTNIGIECVANKTFTDYIDDVSTTYVEEGILIAENGALANDLSNRTDEYLNSEPMPYDENQPRGNPEFKDWYGFLGFTLTYNFMAEKFSNPASSAISCPNF
ncbi:MAG: DUF6089 family protein [Chitinophagales bacterium]